MPADSARRRRRRRRWLGGSFLVLLAVTLTLIETLRTAHQRGGELAANGVMGEPLVSDPQFERTLELLANVHIEPGNHVEQLLNGDGTYPRLWRDLASAQRTIAMQMYYAKPGRVSDTVALLLCDRARAGVRVHLLLDAFGGEAMPAAWLRGMRRCGVEAELLRRLTWYTIHSAAERSHVRAVIVDGRIGYTGGFGLADYWLGDGHHDNQWRESNVRFEGPAVAGLQAAFAAAWTEATGRLLAGEPYFPAYVAPQPGGDSTGARAGVLYTATTVGSTAAERFLALAIRSARSTLYITNSYFVPNEQFRGMLIDAADRGVDVRVLTVSRKTDVKTPWLAGRFYYDELVAHGIRIFEYQPTMMHAKTLVIDGIWGTIGSMNFDNRSLAFNDESNLVVLDRAFGAEMDSVFLDDLRFAREMTPTELAKRRWWARALERGAVLLAHVL